ncbi:MAG: NADP-dependent oxidoreductase [Pseudomonadota bacterium]
MMNRKIVLAEHPNGAPDPSHFKLVEEELSELADDQVVLEVEHLSIDAFIRTMLDATEGFHGASGIDAPVTALGIGRVLRSNFDGLNQGDAVFGPMGAQTHAVGHGSMYRKLEPEGVPARAYLGALGMTTGLTAYAGMIEVGEVKEGDTVLVSAAAGAVGSMACQLAKVKGAKVIGIAGGPAKTAYLTETVGCHGAIDYKADNVADDLRELAPDGVDLFFDNVGGEILDIALDQLAMHGRVVLCGAISQYNNMGDVRGPKLYLRIAERNASMRGFTVDKHAEAFPKMEQDISGWLANGSINMHEQVEEGIERFPEALCMLFNGGHMGKLLVAP